ncbi:MAG: thiamine pyrophosphate-binding protein, partial [Alphaproteobacteria bacterium]|nr:thiamine pyrophosphate-binding protein [Alphaproteobacteria bacterium]
SMSPALGRRMREADLLLVVGARLGDMTTQGYELVDPGQTLIHVHPSPEELGRVWRPALAVAAQVGEFVRALGAVVPPAPPWRGWTETLRAEYEETLRPDPCPGPLDMGRVMAILRERLPEDAVICTGAGNFSGWAQRYWRFRRFPSQLGPTNGAMGYGVPAAVAAALAFPQRLAVAFTGDGDFLMTGQELATAMRHGAKPLILLIDNGMYGTIRMHQERHYPGRQSGTALTNPDFAALARAYGAHGESVARTDEFAPALERSLAAGRAALIALKIDPEAITTRTTLSAIRSRGTP